MNCRRIAEERSIPCRPCNHANNPINALIEICVQFVVSPPANSCIDRSFSALHLRKALPIHMDFQTVLDNGTSLPNDEFS